jgi:hypothetical protein
MSEPNLINRDEEHLRLLTIFFYVCAAMAALFACFPVFHLGLGLVMALKPEVFGPGTNQPPQFIGWFFVAFSSAIILAGWVYAAMLAWAGRCLGRRKHYTFCLVGSCVACLFMPFGTVLGIFSILVLVRPSVKSLFEPGAKSAVSP